MAPAPEARPRIVQRVYDLLKKEVARHMKKYSGIDRGMTLRIKLLDNFELAKFLASTPYDEAVVEALLTIIKVLRTYRFYFVRFKTLIDAGNGAVTCKVTGYFSSKDMKEGKTMQFMLVPLAPLTAKWEEIVRGRHPKLKDMSCPR